MIRILPRFPSPQPRRSVSRLWLGAALLVLAGYAPSVPAGMSLTVDATPTSVTVGQPLRIRASLPADNLSTATFRLQWPDNSTPAPASLQGDDSAHWSTWTLLQEGAVTLAPTATRAREVTYEWILSPFALGDLPGPDVQSSVVMSSGERFDLTAPVTTITVGLTRAEGDADLRDMRPPVSVPLPGWILGTIAAAVLAATGAIAYFAYAHMMASRRRQVPIAPEAALTAQLENLRALDLPRAKRYREFYTRLTDLLRHYLEDRWTIPAPELTTWEIRIAAQELDNTFPHQALEQYLSVFEQADEVKFAQGQSTIEACNRALDTALIATQAFKAELDRREAERSQAESAGNGSAKDGRSRS